MAKTAEGEHFTLFFTFFPNFLALIEGVVRQSLIHTEEDAAMFGWVSEAGGEEEMQFY